MKKILILTILLGLFISNKSLCQGFCLTKSIKLINNTPSSQRIASQPCKLYTIRVYVHRINSNGGNGYSSGIEYTIINNLNSSLNSYGLFFVLSGSRTWYSDQYGLASASRDNLQGIFNNPNNEFQGNAINIYVLPANSQINGGFVPSENKQILLVGGIRSVNHCQLPQNNVQYEIATSKVVCHEMGHCFGLIHTFDNNGDDEINDTPIDNVDNDAGGQGCINTSNCQFTGSCSSCNLPSNPTTNMNNFMSYTVPSCMSYFSVGQLDKMRENLNSSISSVILNSHEGSPSLMNVNYDNYSYANTVNFVSPNYHSVQTNESVEALIIPIN